MGTLKTTNIETISGSGTLTLGTSGETIAAGSGVTIGSGLGKVLQVVQATTTSDLSNNTTSYVASGFTAALTPSATSSKILIQLSGGSMDYAAAALDVYCALYTDTGGGGYAATTSFTRTRVDSAFGMPNCQTLLLSPSTTSAVTVQPYIKSSSSNAAYINRNSVLLTLTLTEIAG